MNDDVNWSPQIVAAEAFTASHFAVAYGELEYDDPFTIILEYDQAFPQPWSRTNISREITAITRAGLGAEQAARFVALSNEGDVYFIGDETTREKIIGAGIASKDSTGAGGVFGLADIDGSLFAAGQGEQIYKRVGSRHWERIPFAIACDSGFEPTAFSKLAGSSKRDIYLIGVAAPSVPKLDEKTEQNLLASGDWDAWNKAHDELFAQSGFSSHVDGGRAYHWNGADWRRIDLPTSSVIKDIYIETPDEIWLVGMEGAILTGNARAGFRLASSIGDTETLLSFTRFHDIYVAASDYALHTFDGHRLSPLKPRLRRSPPTPFRVQSPDGILFYFDYKQGIHRFDGTNWERIEIPSELLERDFKGLNRTSP